MRGRSVAAGVAVAALSAAAIGSTTGTAGADPPGPGQVTVTGTGSVRGTPDTVLLEIGVAVTRRDVSAALRAASDRVDALDAALRGQGVAERDVQTAGLTVSPSFDRRGRPSGYEVTEALTAELRDLGRAGAAVAAAVAAAGNDARVEGLTPELQDAGGPLAKARDAAFTDARAKAEQYARLAGRALGRVTSVTEKVQAVDGAPTGLRTTAAAAGTPGGAVPVSPGSTPVEVGVTVVFSLG